MTGEQLAAEIDRIVTETRDSLGTLGKLSANVYEGSDGKFVTVMLTDYEAWMVELAVYGEEVATYNYAIRHP